MAEWCRCEVGVTEGFQVEVGLHQGSVDLMMDRLTDEAWRETPRTMTLQDDSVICHDSREQVVKTWRRGDMLQREEQ